MPSSAPCSFWLIASFIGVPLGIGAGIYLSEYGKNRYSTWSALRPTFSTACRPSSSALRLYALVVLRQGHFSAMSGGVALGIMMIPTIARTTEEMLLMVPVRGARSGAWTGNSAVAQHAFRCPANCPPRQ